MADDDALEHFTDDEEEELFAWMDHVFWQEYKGIIAEALARREMTKETDADEL